VEGPTDDPAIAALRSRQIKNMLATLMLSQGVPMVVAGNECRRTQRGNNNAYCQDNDISWFDWTLVEKNAELVRFFQGLAHFRRSQPTVRRKHFLSGQPVVENGLPDVSWFNALGVAVDWRGNDAALTCLLMPPQECGPERKGNCGNEVLFLVNATSNAREFILPAVAKGLRWRLFIDTAAESPQDIYPELDGPPPVTGALALLDRSLRCYVAESDPDVTKAK
jgi:glycogen operon protein